VVSHTLLECVGNATRSRLWCVCCVLLCFYCVCCFVLLTRYWGNRGHGVCVLLCFCDSLLQDSSWVISSSPQIAQLQCPAREPALRIFGVFGSMGAKWLFQLRSAPGQQVGSMNRITCRGTRWLDDVCPHCHGLHGPHESEYQTWCVYMCATACVCVCVCVCGLLNCEDCWYRMTGRQGAPCRPVILY